MAHDATVPGWNPPARIAGNSRANLRSTWVFTVLWNTVSAPILVYVPPEVHRNPLAAIGFLFPITGAGLLVWAVLSTLRRRRFGESWLESPSDPAAPGSGWAATVHVRLPEPATPAGYTVTLRLTCLRRTISHSDGERTEHERILWREDAEVPSSQITFGPDDAAIPVRFEFPADALETTAVGGGEGVLWVLTAEAALPGVNLREDFDVPVRAGVGAAASATVPARRSIAAAAAVTADDVERTGITVRPDPEGTAFAFAAMRNVSFAAGVTAFTAIWTGALWLQWFVGFPWIFPLITGLVDVLLVVVSADLWLGSTRVTAGAGLLRVRHTVLGIGRTRTIAAADVAAIGLNINMQTEGRFGTPYYEIQVTLRNGRKASLAGGIRNKRHAEWLSAQIRSAIGRRD